jgi:hypothetical protein
MYNILCISASNIQHAQKNSTSLHICQLIKDIISNRNDSSTSVEILSLTNYELLPCIGCGNCYQKRQCVTDEAFNSIYDHLNHSDGLFIVSAHYAPIPSKLCILLEKIEQLAFLPRFHDESNHSPLYNRPVGIIAHGGGTVEIMKNYQSLVIDTIANALSWPVDMNIIAMDNDGPRGVILPVKSVIHDDMFIFPIQEYDWKDIKSRIEPLVLAVYTTIMKNAR